MTNKTSQRLIEKLELLEKYQKMNGVLSKESERMEEFVAKLGEEEAIALLKQKINNK